LKVSLQHSNNLLQINTSRSDFRGEEKQEPDSQLCGLGLFYWAKIRRDTMEREPRKRPTSANQRLHAGRMATDFDWVRERYRA